LKQRDFNHDKTKPSAAKYVSQPHRPRTRMAHDAIVASGKVCIRLPPPPTGAEDSSVTSAMADPQGPAVRLNGCFCENKSTIVFHRILDHRVC
jgi:hypothetical protein